MKEVYIIIVTYNAMTWLKDCLDSCINYKVIVVDNNSSDETVSYIFTNYPEVILLPQQDNLGFGKGNNIGISYAIKAGCDYVFLLNQDAYIVNNALERLLEIHSKNPNYGVLSPIHTNKNGNLLDKKFSYYLHSSSNNSFFSDYVLNNKLQEIYDVPFVNAAAWLVSKKSLLEVGGFDPMFFLYGEDDNLCQRMLFHNYKIGVVSKTEVIHDREFRKKTYLKEYSEVYYKQLVNSFKINFGDVNKKNIDFKIRNKKLFICKQILKNIFTIRFSSAFGELEKFKILKSSEKKIIKSYNTNKSKGSHYLKV
ncbi:glycosyltransferase family 2 protein [Polaribacter sp. Asnod1-A03]|uniref:glycosyltransferase family 2 protein n=1 Tax=Polaribacter sp. Asnod1-A03 TaxID=3160581 RepID=UPI00386F1127